MKRLLRRLAPVAWLSLFACTPAPATGPSAPLAGAWRTIAIPSGSGIWLSLSTNRQLVTGTGHEYRMQYLADDLSVVGHQQVGGTFNFDVSFGSGATATYSGRLAGSDQLDGTWTDAGQAPYSLSFYRQPQ